MSPASKRSDYRSLYSLFVRRVCSKLRLVRRVKKFDFRSALVFKGCGFQKALAKLWDWTSFEIISRISFDVNSRGYFCPENELDLIFMDSRFFVTLAPSINEKLRFIFGSDASRFRTRVSLLFSFFYVCTLERQGLPQIDSLLSIIGCWTSRRHWLYCFFVCVLWSGDDAF